MMGAEKTVRWWVVTSSRPSAREKTEQVRRPESALSSHCRLTDPEPRDSPRVLDTGIWLACKHITPLISHISTGGKFLQVLGSVGKYWI